MSRILLFIFCLLIIVGCNDFDDVDPGVRSTFIKFFGNSNEDLGNQIRETPDGGYIIIGTSSSDTLDNLVLIKIDQFGNTEWDQVFPSAEGLAVRVMEDGYLIIGDIVVPIDANETVTSIFVAKTDLSGNITASASFGDENTDDPLDYHGSALTIDQNNNIYVLGTKENELDLEETVVVAYDQNFNMLWNQEYFLQGRSTLVSRNIHINGDNNLIWTSSAFLIQGDSDDGGELDFDSFFNIPTVGLNAQQVNNDNFGQNLPANYLVSDINPGTGGYGIIGTYSINNRDDILFIRTRNNGSVIDGSERIFDLGSQENGYSLSRTRDGGYILLGSVSTNTQVGNGGLDILLIKTDSQGNELWTSTFGGSGDEIGNSIIQTPDGGYVIFGTQILQGFSMMMMVKTNDQGQLVEN